MYDWKMCYQIGDGFHTLIGSREWLLSQWSIIVATNPGAKLIWFQIITEA